jgi:hypothetical protein
MINMDYNRNRPYECMRDYHSVQHLLNHEGVFPREPL